MGKLHRHELKCEPKTRLRFPGGAYVVPPTIFEQLADEGIEVPAELRYFKYFATFDFEKFVDYLVQVSRESYRLLLNDFEGVFACIEDQIGEHDNMQEMVELLVGLQEESEQNERGIDVMMSDDEEEEIESENDEDRAFLDDGEEIEEDGPGFYRALNRDLDEMQEERVEEESHEETEGQEKKKPHPMVKLKFIYKNFLCLVSTTGDHLKFLDITNYLAPGFDYDQFLKAYECQASKGFLPYEWLEDIEKLDHTDLLPHAAFFSTLKNTNITTDEYAYCQQVAVGMVTNVSERDERHKKEAHE
ncbi:hypothetical protein QZH41_001005 [Actinostola sp. cb2023]|nr:hypothetical protein QZH41_001005 [Actinostola sp. cb2023]